MILLAFGLIMVFSASYASAYYNQEDSFYFVKQQLFAAVLGLLVMGVVIVSDYKWLKVVSVPLMVVSILLLIAVLFIGTTRNNATRWIYIGPVNFQPSEITKIALIIFFSHCMATYQKYMKSFKTGILPYLAILGIISFLLIKEPHFSATLLIGMLGMIMIFVGGGGLKWFVGMAAAGASAAAYLLFFTNYTKARIETWLHPEADPSGHGYQILQSLYAIGSGGLMGLGLGQSRQKYLYLPEAHNDFIFSILCEELGFIGAAFVMILFALLIWRGFVIAFRAPDRFGTLLVVGVTTLVSLQVLINIAVVTNFMPVTGMPLPFFSYGGTSLLMLLFEMGIVLNVSRYSSGNNRG
jgi:cell division protein FtsW